MNREICGFLATEGLRSCRARVWAWAFLTLSRGGPGVHSGNKDEEDTWL